MNKITLIPNVVLSEDARKCWYHEFLRNSNTLVITAGDSWTWGDSLGTINSATKLSDDYDHRTTHIYGRLLADKLDADFLNIAKCGGSNAEIHDHIIQALSHVHNNYEKIYVFVTLTEIGREMYGDPMWISDGLLDKGLDDFLQGYEWNMFRSFKKEIIDKYPAVVFKIARNFTYSFDENIAVLAKEHLRKTWVDCLAEYQNKKSYPENVRVLSSISIVPIQMRLKKLNIYKKLKFQFFEYFADANLAITFLEESALNYKKATKHPTEKGHEIWADYLYATVTSEFERQ